MKWVWRLLLIAFLTILTQVGGLVYLLSVIVFDYIWKPKQRRWLKRNTLFLSLYLFATFVMVPALATLSGRKALPINGDHIKSQNYFTVLANRRYVDEPLYDLLKEVGTDFHGLKALGKRKVLYLDANFPFFDGFPLLPHLSHDDGKKVDLCLRYRTSSDDRVSNKVPAIIGYGVYEEPKPGEVETNCKASNPWYNASRIFGFRTDGDSLVFDEQETKKLIDILIRKNISKIFIEPHLKQRLKLASPKVRFHGCHAVRHDDHIHVEIP